MLYNQNLSFLVLMLSLADQFTGDTDGTQG